MNLRVIYFCLFSILFTATMAQSEQFINKTDNTGKKQGHWIKKYPDGNIMYDGFFRNDKPVGEFRRYYEDKTLKSLLVFSDNSTEALATLYYQNGFVASRGKYVNQLKEGKWQFFSVLNKGVLISEENYLNDKKNGLCRKFYPDSRVAEALNFHDDIKNGEWLNYHPNGSLNFRTNYSNGKLNGNFEAFFADSKPEVTGKYKDDLREGVWIIYNKDGSQRFKTEYSAGIPNNSAIDIYETDYIDSLERNKIKIADPEKTGEKW